MTVDADVGGLDGRVRYPLGSEAIKDVLHLLRVGIEGRRGRTRILLDTYGDDGLVGQGAHMACTGDSDGVK